MSRDELLAQLRDELRGLLMESFAAAKNIGDWAKDGRLITQQLNRSTDLFARIVNAARVPEEKPKPEIKPAPSNGQPTQPVRR